MKIAKIKLDPNYVAQSKADQAFSRVRWLCRVRWLYSLTVALLVDILTAHYRRHSWTWVEWLMLAEVPMFVCLAVIGWRAWRRLRHPDGVRLVVRFWGRAGSPAETLPVPSEVDGVWPPAPKRPL